MMLDVYAYIVLPIIGSVFIVAAIMHAMKCMGTEDIICNKKKFFIETIYIVISILVSMLGNGVINLFILMILPGMGHFIYNRSKTHLLYYSILISIVYLTDLLALFVLQGLCYWGIISFISPQLSQVFIIFFMRIIEYMVIKCYVFVINRNVKGGISFKQLIISIIFSICSIFFCFSIVYLAQIYIGEFELILIIVNILLIVLLNFYFGSVFDIIMKNNRLQNELNLYKQQSDMQYKYYEGIEKRYDSSRKLIHDIRNHVQSMEQLYTQQENEKGIVYAQDIHGMLSRLGQVYYTGNKVLNIILNDKVSKMDNMGIRHEIRIGDINLDFMKDVDITTIFANIIDNAIEAAKEAVDKYIIVNADSINDFVSFNVKNSMKLIPLKDKKGIFHTTKENHQGIGLGNVKLTLQKYNGDLIIDYNEKEFMLRIMIC